MIMKFYLPFPGRLSLSEMLLERAAQQGRGSCQAGQRLHVDAWCWIHPPPELFCSASVVYLFSRMQQSLLRVQRGVKAGNEQLRLSSAAACGSWDVSLAHPAQTSSPQAPSGCPTAFPSPARAAPSPEPPCSPESRGCSFPVPSLPSPALLSCLWLHPWSLFS